MTTRFNLEFPDDYKFVVAGLMEKTRLRTQKDVFENALALFGWAVQEVSRGKVIASLDEATKSYGQIHMPALMNIARSSPDTPPPGRRLVPAEGESADDQSDGHRNPDRKIA